MEVNNFCPGCGWIGENFYCSTPLKHIKAERDRCLGILRGEIEHCKSNLQKGAELGDYKATKIAESKIKALESAINSIQDEKIINFLRNKPVDN